MAMKDMERIFLEFTIIFLTFFVLHAHALDCDCSKYVDSLWQMKPVGEGQLFGILRKIEAKYGKSKHYPSRNELFDVLYHQAHSPFDGLDAGHNDTSTYLSSAEVTAKPITKFVISVLGGPPKFALEVGTFIGNGAISVWGPMVKNSTDGFVLCVDSWEGDINMRLGPQFQEFMSLKHGMPILFSRFMHRVKQHNMHEHIYPLPMPSLTAARLLASLNWIVDVIYLDSAHEIGETFAELYMYFQLVRSGGILMGDDYVNFPAVKHDVDLFVAYKGNSVLTFTLIVANQWAILKH